MCLALHLDLYLDQPLSKPLDLPLSTIRHSQDFITNSLDGLYIMISQSICHGSVVRARAGRYINFTRRSVSRFGFEFAQLNSITLHPAYNSPNKSNSLFLSADRECPNNIGMNHRWQLQIYCQVNPFNRFIVQLLTLRQGL